MHNVIVSDLAVCQRCPGLFAYIVLKGEARAWDVGISGKGHAYGTIFHNSIAKVFFMSASKPKSRLYPKIAQAVSSEPSGLYSMIRDNIFMPYLDKNSNKLTSGQIISMAKGVTVWAKTMYEYFRAIPSLIRDPEKYMSTVFREPEGNLEAVYDYKGVELNIRGRYDAVVFNPDKGEARLFEFKGYMKGDMTVPLSQSLIYSWLIYKGTGIVPSIEIIYLDEEDKSPDIFDSRNVKGMIKAGLPELFSTVYNIITKRRLPVILTEKKLCSECRYNKSCVKDWGRRRKGVTMISVLAFLAAAAIIASQIFFFANMSNESLVEQRDMMRIRFMLDDAVREAVKIHLTSNTSTPEIIYNNHTEHKDRDYDEFYNQTKVYENTNSSSVTVIVNDLKYTLTYDTNRLFDSDIYSKVPAYKRLFPPMSNDHYLIRAYTNTKTAKSLMYQVLVQVSGSSKIIKSWQEIWYDNIK